MCIPQYVIACSSTGLAFRVAYLEGTVLELCPSLHLNALIHSVRLLRFMRGVANGTAYCGKRDGTVHQMHWSIWL